MDSINNVDHIIRPPRPLWHLEVSFLVLIPIAMTLIFTWVEILENPSDRDLFVPLLLATTVIIIGALFLIFFCRRVPDNKYKLVISPRNNKLFLFKDNGLEQEYNLNNIKRIISRLTLMFNQKDYILLIEDNSGDSHALFDLRGGKHFSTKQWHIFSKKLAELLDKDYEREVWVEDFEGKLHTKPSDELRTFNYEKLVVLPIMAIPIMSAFGYNHNPSVGSFFGYGIAAACTSVFLTMIFSKSFMSKSDAEKGTEQGIYKLMVFPVLFIRYITAYAMAVLIIKLYSSNF